LVVLGFCITAGFGMTIGGCAAAKNYLPLCLLIPAGLGVVCQYGINRTSEEGVSGAKIPLTGWIFLLSMCLTSVLAIPIVFWNVFSLKDIACGLPVGGGLIILIGCVICAYLQGTDESQDVGGFF
jgi:hypothetical protein